MTISTNDRRTGPFAGNGSTKQFSGDFPISADADVIVEVRNTSTGVDTIKTLTADYVITNKTSSGFTVLFVTAPSASEQVIIRAAETITQDVDFDSFSSFPSEANEGALDKLTRQVQDLRECVGRAVKLSPFDAGASDVRLPPLAGQAGNTLIVNGDEDGLNFGAPLAIMASVDVSPGWQRVAQSVGDQTTSGASNLDTALYIIPANTFTEPGDAIRVRVWFNVTNTNAVANVQVRFASFVTGIQVPTGALRQGLYEAVIEAKTATTQFGASQLWVNNTNGSAFGHDTDQQDASQDMTVNRTVTVRAFVANAADTLTIKKIEVDRLGLSPESVDGDAVLVTTTATPILRAETTEEIVDYVNGVLEVPTITTLKALSPGVVDAVLVRGRDAANDIPPRIWRWSDSDLSSAVTADARSARYAAPIAAPTGASGAWVGDLPEGEAVFDLTHYLDGDDYQAITAGDIDAQDLADVMTAVRAWGDAALAWLDDAPEPAQVVLSSPPGVVALRDEVWSDTALALLWGTALDDKRIILRVGETIWKVKDWRAHDPEGNGKRATRTMPTGAWLAGEPVPAAVWRFEGTSCRFDCDTLRVHGSEVDAGIGEGPTAEMVTDPQAIHMVGVNLMKGDGHFVEHIGGSALWIDGAFNSDWESEELKGGWQPVEGGVILSGRAGAPTGDVIFDYTDNGDGTGTIEAFSYTDWNGSSTETAIAYFAAGHVGKEFYIDNAMDNGGTLAVEIDAIGGSPSGSSATVSILGSSTTIGTSAAKVSGSFGPIRGTISASSNALVLSDPVDSTPDASGPVDSDPNLIGRYVYVEGAGDDARSNVGGLLARITAVDYTAGVMTWTLSESAAFSVTDARVLMNPTKFVGITGDASLSSVNNTGVARSRVEVFAAWNAVPALYMGVVHHIESDSKWHGPGEGKATWGQGWNFAGSARCAILDDCQALSIYGLELDHGYGHDAGKILVCGQDGTINIEGLRQTQSNATVSPQVASVVEIDPLSTHTAVLVRMGGQYGNLSAQQSIATYGSSGDATMLDHRLIRRAATTVPAKVFPAGIAFEEGGDALSFYEEGTFTPVFTCATPGDLDVTHSSQVGRFWRINSLVFFRIRLLFSTNNYTTATGGVVITGLPYTSANDHVNIGSVIASQADIGSNDVSLVWSIQPNSNVVNLLAQEDGAANTTVSIAYFPASGSYSLTIQGFYRAA